MGLNVDLERPSPGHSEFTLGPDVSMDSDINLDHPPFSQGYISPGRSNFSQGSKEDEDLLVPLGPIGSDAAEPHVPNSPYVPRVYHTKLDGMFQHLFYHLLTLMISCRKDL